MKITSINHGKFEIKISYEIDGEKRTSTDYLYRGRSNGQAERQYLEKKMIREIGEGIAMQAYNDFLDKKVMP